MAARSACESSVVHVTAADKNVREATASGTLDKHVVEKRPDVLRKAMTLKGQRALPHASGCTRQGQGQGRVEGRHPHHFPTSLRHEDEPSRAGVAGPCRLDFGEGHDFVVKL